MQTDLVKLLDEFKKIPRHKRTKTFMEIAGYPHYENVCSNILSFYLNPHEEHGLKDLVLKSLMNLVDEKFCCEKVDCIEREYLTKSNKRIDLVILTEKYVIGIENKIFSGLHNDLTDYYDTVKSLCNDEKKHVCIVLSLNKLTSPADLEKMVKNKFENITYEEIFFTIKKNIGKYITNSNISYINHLTDFVKTIENLKQRIMENKELWAFFKNDPTTMQDLAEKFVEFRRFQNEKVIQLKDAMPIDVYAPSAISQRFYIHEQKNIFREEYCLVHDYEIKSYRFAIEAYMCLTCWNFYILAKDEQSAEFLFNVMGKDNDFSYEGIMEPEGRDRMIIDDLNADEEISVVVKTLSEWLSRIEKFKEKFERENPE